MQLIQPCAQVRLLPSPDGCSSPLIQVCPVRYIARGVGQRFCLQCSDAAGIAPNTSSAGLVGYPSEGYGQLCPRPHPHPHPPLQPEPRFQCQLQILQQEKGENGGVLRTPTPLDPEILGSGLPAAGDLLPSAALGQVLDSGSVCGGEGIMEDGVDKPLSRRSSLLVQVSSDMKVLEKSVIVDEERGCGAATSCIPVSISCGLEERGRNTQIDQMKEKEEGDSCERNASIHQMGIVIELDVGESDDKHSSRTG
ncbi:uncharacterized protein ACLA_041000 [Aspergillus clavatus NRRL 1]|uniref:Uncharacterized protein n=1 Tax=Aspergillus clavatus (strain ATCC 1007 / CBS 513.65 / DSM 816 / NCTC 3887 / NRRL 1 / QM 1276 / 107) TaxID=344612 RepID=A1CL60_ASPCL|nr:uncharacterized protein ACLA_041000 [Aspergillus clavatus NRRL 1]EAW09884.1 hypothetical protein ACLA_041000 [Aspergillus clavatus NRRL 1]